MTFDPDHDLTKDFNELVGGKKKKSDFNLSSESSKLDFSIPMTNGVIRKGSKIALRKRGRGRPSKTPVPRFKTNVIKKGAKIARGF